MMGVAGGPQQGQGPATLFMDSVSKLTPYLDPLLPPARRAHYRSQIAAFATTNPLLSTFIISQIVFCGTPLLLFTLFSASVLLFSLATALVLAIVSALLFTAVLVGVAGLVLAPALLVSVFFAGSVWIWAWGIWYTANWLGFTGRGEEKGGREKERKENEKSKEGGFVRPEGKGDGENKKWDGKWEQELRRSSEKVMQAQGVDPVPTDRTGEEKKRTYSRDIGIE